MEQSRRPNKLVHEKSPYLLQHAFNPVAWYPKVEIYHLINALVEAGVGVLFISSEMIEVLGMSDRILVMREGRLVGDVGREEASEERLLQLAAGVARAAGAADVTPGVIATEGKA